ncbi:hypothetical protein Tco_1057502 [Tanacetum coccineum]|uniref:Uncharacterized protein n=1 Tax=Tanacetum coccineum TaxID=301880 RepID=A0ABQ5H764_9ASTR
MSFVDDVPRELQRMASESTSYMWLQLFRFPDYIVVFVGLSLAPAKKRATKPTLAPPCDPSNRRCVGESTSRPPCNYELQLPQVPPVGLVFCPSTRVHNGNSVEHNALARDVYGNVGVVVLSISLKRRCIGAPSSTSFCDQQLPLPQLAPVGSTVFSNTCEHQSTSVPSRNINLHSSEASPVNSHQSVSQSMAAVGGNRCTISDSGNHAVRDCNEQARIRGSCSSGDYGYPRLIVLDIKKHAYAPLKSAFERDQIIDFLKAALPCIAVRQNIESSAYHVGIYKPSRKSYIRYPPSNEC